jgi:uncharacterized protein (TIGR00269 family)
MFSPQDHIALGLSGGKDSTALLQVLHTIERKFPQAQLSAIIIDEGIHQYRHEALQLAKLSCQRFNVPLHLFSFKQLFAITLDQLAETPQTHRQVSFCSFCGILRRKALNIAAKRINASKLVLAHNLDDELQSMFLSLLRGDLISLSKIHPVLGRISGFVPKVKPFSEILEREIALYAYFNNLAFQTLPCPYQTSSMRTDIRAFLNQLEHNHPGIKYSTYRNFAKLIPNQPQTVQKTLTRCHICGEPAASLTCRACALLQSINNTSV